MLANLSLADLSISAVSNGRATQHPSLSQRANANVPLSYTLYMVFAAPDAAFGLVPAHWSV